MWFDMAIPTLLFIGFCWLISKVFDTSSRPPTKKEVDDFMKLFKKVQEENRKNAQEHLRKIGKL